MKGEEEMWKKTYFGLVVIFSIIAFGIAGSGCAKKQVVKEDTGAKPAMEAKRETVKPPAPLAVEKPKREAKAEPPAPAPASAPPPVLAPAPSLAPVAPPPEAKIEAVSPTPAQAALYLRKMTIRFAFDDYTLSPKAKENLEKIGTWMSENPGVKIQIQGNTCDIGTAEYNLALGEQRAKSAKRYLEGLGISASRLTTVSYGEERPAISNKDEESRSQNRRDEFVSMQ